MKKMPAHLVASENYVWSTGNVLGKGATGAVYQGVHKENGETVAIKTFNHVSHMRPDHVQMREFEMLKKVNHKNIVQLLSIEQEQGSDNKVLVMELCTGGSLFNILDDPENAYGLKETEFILVLKHVTAGMKHLRDNKIVHRDLKPGNIMKYITANGRSLYKLTDFGAARELTDDQQFMSLYGTEEYLHPDMYERAVLRKSAGKGFAATVDLWSIGVTLYHIVTGSLPFRPFGGRKNTETMFYITTEKESGVISGVQLSENGPIEWSKNLPDTCQLSIGLRKLVTPLLAGLLESDPTKIWSFEQFFTSVTDILSQHLIHLFDVHSGKSLHIYVHPEDTYDIVQYTILEQTDVSPEKQIILTTKKHLKDAVAHETLAQNFPETSTELPLFLLQVGVSTIDIQKKPYLPKFPNMSSSVSLDNDASVGKIYCGLAYCLKRLIDKSLCSDSLFLTAAKCTLNVLQTQLRDIEQKLKHLHSLVERDIQLTQVLSSCFKFCASVLDIVFPNSSFIADTSSKTLRDAVIDKEEIIQSLNDSLMAIAGKMKPLTQEFSSQETKLSQWKSVAKNSKENNRYGNIASTLVQKIRDSWQCLNRDRTLRCLSYNDEQFHRLEKRKLQETSQKLLRLYQNDCLQSNLSSAENLSKILNSAETCNAELRSIKKDVASLERRLTDHNLSLDDARKEFDLRLNQILHRINEEWVLRKKENDQPETKVETEIGLLKQQKMNQLLKESLHQIYALQAEVHNEGKLAKAMVKQISEFLSNSLISDEDSPAKPATTFSQ